MGPQPLSQEFRLFTVPLQLQICTREQSNRTKLPASSACSLAEWHSPARGPPAAARFGRERSRWPALPRGNYSLIPQTANVAHSPTFFPSDRNGGQSAPSIHAHCEFTRFIAAHVTPLRAIRAAGSRI